jgi:hypothetical protein
MDEKRGAHDYCFPSTLTWMVANWGANELPGFMFFLILFAVFCMHWFRTGIPNAHPVFDGE